MKMTPNHIMEEYNISYDDMEKKLYEMLLDMGMDDDGLIAIVSDAMLAGLVN